MITRVVHRFVHISSLWLAAAFLLACAGILTFLAARSKDDTIAAPPSATDCSEGRLRAVDRLVAENGDVVQELPRHAKSGELLRAVVNIYTSELHIDEPEAYLRIAKDYPDSNLGLYALSMWLDNKGESEESLAILWGVVRDRSDARVAKLALDQILSSAQDPAAICRKVISEFRGTAVGAYACERTAKQLCASGDHLEGIRLYLDCCLDAINNRRQGLDGLRPKLASAFVEASLAHYAASVSAMKEYDLEAQRTETQRLRELILKMAGQIADKMTRSHENYYPALWKVRADREQLASFVELCPDVLIAETGRLFLANLELEAGDIEASLKVAQEFLCRWEGLDADFTEKANLILDAAFFLADLKEKGKFSLGTSSSQAAPQKERLSWDAGVRLEQCEDEMTVALEHLFGHLKASPASDAETVAMLFRLAGAFRVWLRTSEELEVIKYLCSAFPHRVDAASLHLRAARLYAERWQAYRNAAEEYRVARRLQKSPEALEAALLEARNFYIAEDYEEALPCLREVIRNDTHGELTEDALLLEALTRFRLGSCETAVQVLNRLVAEHPTAARSDKVLFLKAYFHLVGGSYDDATEAFQEFMREAPDSELGSIAQRILEELRNVPRKPDATIGQDRQVRNPRPNVILISLDTVRADHLSCYGYARPTTPSIDKIAQEGVIFTAAVSASSWTKPSHASVFTSLYPSVHGASGIDSLMNPACKTMAQIFGELGYATLGVISAPFLSSSFGFDRGFHVYDDYTFDLDRDFNLFRRDMTESQQPSPASERGFTSSLVTGRALSLIRGTSKDKPFFLFLNYFDPHINYSPPWPYSTMFDQEKRGVVAEKMNFWKTVIPQFPTIASEDDIAHMMGLYDGEIAYMDQQVGKLIESLKEQDIYSNTIFIVFGDHGEEFLEHGGISHSRTLYEEVTHAPLIVEGPGVPKGTWSGHPVSLVDILPTLLSLVSAKVPIGTQGRDILPNITETVGEDGPPVFSEVDSPFALQPAHIEAVVRGDTKLILHPRDDSIELYDLKADKSEKRNLAGEQPDLVAGLWKDLVGFDLQNRTLRSKLVADERERGGPSGKEMERIRARLRSLGYIR